MPFSFTSGKALRSAMVAIALALLNSCGQASAPDEWFTYRGAVGQACDDIQEAFSTRYAGIYPDPAFVSRMDAALAGVLRASLMADTNNALEPISHRSRLRHDAVGDAAADMLLAHMDADTDAYLAAYDRLKAACRASNDLKWKDLS